MNINMYNIIKDLFPICRSITGSGIKKSLKYLENIIPEFKRLRYKSGTKVFDWTIPNEWNISDAYVLDIDKNKKIIDFKKNNLHVLNFSTPIDRILSKKELEKNLYSLPKQPKLIPYVTSYYKKNWGFCLSENDRSKLKNKYYKVVIKSQHKKGYLDLTHALFPGEKKDEIFFSSYLCHPSMANNELSGPALIIKIADYVKKLKKRNFSYRFVILPETIGSISYIYKYKSILKKNVKCGFNLSCVGDNKEYSHIESRLGDTLADQALNAAFIGLKEVKRYSYLYRGSDERQYCSPGIDLPLCGFSRTKYGEYKEYHTSGDNLDFISREGLENSFKIFKQIIDCFEDCYYPKTKTMCEPHLSKHGLYSFVSIKSAKKRNITLDLLSYSDGNHNIFKIAQLTNLPLNELYQEFLKLSSKKLIENTDV